MAPSRGFLRLWHTPLRPSIIPITRLSSQRFYQTFTEDLANPTKKVQSYVSSSSDPYLNLSIEDHILQKSSPDSTILFLYTNRPCVVIGRNQNPWLEVNLRLLNAATAASDVSYHIKSEPPAIGNVDLVRRRSGGGTVFHDEGNVNWSITCPRSDFTRDKHAEMVVRALRKLGVERARVNERHDIVLDLGEKKHAVDAQDTHQTPYTVEEGDPRRPLKVSGSAYKLTRGRALHHGTALVASPNLHIIGQYLKSPAKEYIEAKGVESVSSPITNMGLENSAFEKGVQDAFATMYATTGSAPVIETVGKEYLNIPEIKKGYDELLTPDWLFAQTPAFKLRFREQNAPNMGPPNIDMSVRHGIIESCSLENVSDDTNRKLMGTKLLDVKDWKVLLRELLGKDKEPSAKGVHDAAGTTLQRLLPIPDVPSRNEEHL
ncbi:hypothetical protein BDV96DRAFT_489278 [Lophiotrema nucula]|uniref:Putative lipoate-protein ligase A n=1 Tax=Lophiotrema nucula TaxID=690887 RepID=A0A6A5ZG26_9PLEO|nr:hypothetical protein BDV96DRAFT_489278 [Lophiotrema nucula]